ncbi:proton channel OtopLc-like isoform X2 [Frankliniella occidentalis]|uniref:Proton channel OtopLc-like isoform X2 n=1 Tax=Frankliniella occidentalis TaxID=133901 RepID=A0A6J1SAK0_FRAOC|nr:proton channel OtopLc-like isoform X2 [Frankliniella occidentalis]
MRTVAEEYGSEFGAADDSSGSEQPVPRVPSRTLPRRGQAGGPRLDPVWEPRDSFTSFSSSSGANGGGGGAGAARTNERHLIFLEPPSSSSMDRRGWRRPSAPSIFHHIETALGRRPSVTPAPAVTVLPSAPAPAPTSILRSTAASPAMDVTPIQHACGTVALRRPSAVVLMSHHSPDEQRRLMDSPDVDLDRSNHSFTPLSVSDEYLKVTPKFDDTITVYLSAMYAKLLVTLGIAFPILETIYEEGKYYQGFYLYLYFGTFFFLLFMYGNVLKKRAVIFLVNTYRRKGSQPRPSIDSTLSGIARPGPRKHYGSFYLRLGAIAFGIGSMVYSGLEFGQFFELRTDCRFATQALTPAARMVLTLVQMQFIFLNNREMDMLRHKVVAQFGLMHMIATNLCEWLTVIIEEAKHEIHHLHLVGGLASLNDSLTEDGGGHHHHVATRSSHDGPHDAVDECIASDILGALVRNASPFLFPCTIEYSLICAVVLFEMWKVTHRDHAGGHGHGHGHGHGNRESREPESPHENGRSASHLSLDCTKAHKGLFAGIVVVVLTIISLILFFVLNEAPGFSDVAMHVVIVCELGLYVVTTLAVLMACYQIRALKYIKKTGGLGLDNTLLVMAQAGVFLYNVFSVLAYSSTGAMPRLLVSELIALIQTICQTIFVLDATRRRCSSPREHRRKPGRQMVTFLLVANMAMWCVNTMEKSRARSRPNLMKFYGEWPWTLIVHISMPLAIFYRFHSTICLFEIWKVCYKLKQHPQSMALGLRKHTDSERSDREGTG